MTSFGMRIFVISLPGSDARRRTTREQLGSLGLAAEFVDAVDAMGLPNEAAEHGLPAAPQQVATRLTRKELACLRSHCLVYERIVREQVPMSVILEDDCSMLPGFARVLQAIDARAAAWDVLLLGHHSRRRDPVAGAETCYRPLAKGDGFRVARVAEFPMGAYAYVVSARGARALLEYARPERMPADWVVGYSPAAGVRLYAVKPPCVTPHPAVAEPTTIDDRATSGESRHAEHLWRRRLGEVLLRVRKAGIWPAGYAKRLDSRSAARDRRGGI